MLAGLKGSPTPGRYRGRGVCITLVMQGLTCIFPKSNGGGGIRTRDLLNAIQEGPHRNPLSCQVDAPSPSSGCTTGCTTEPKPAQADPLAAIAAALLGLSPEDRARLAAM